MLATKDNNKCRVFLRLKWMPAMREVDRGTTGQLGEDGMWDHDMTGDGKEAGTKEVVSCRIADPFIL
jgi:hypothetical protein